jgi:hypothetical protein
MKKSVSIDFSNVANYLFAQPTIEEVIHILIFCTNESTKIIDFADKSPAKGFFAIGASIICFIEYNFLQVNCQKL